MEQCGDNRFQLIEEAKKELIEKTNIESRPEEMAVLDNILFRFWQMGWLPQQQREKAWSIIEEMVDECEGKGYCEKRYITKEQFKSTMEE